MDFHVLQQAEDEKTISVVFHYFVPATNNAVGVAYRTALVNYLGGADAITSAVADSTEIISLKAGELYEVQTSVRWSKLGLTDAQKLVEISAAYSAKQVEIIAYFGTVLAYYGHKGDV